jgi:serine/threonine protein kinase/Tfp pilus assembly protein PilF
MATICPKCQTLNPDDSKFCKECAAALPTSKDTPVSVTKTLETPREDLIRGTLLAGRYEIIEKLGTGGMGTVYRVEDAKIKEEVALKLLKPDISVDKKIIERFRNELKLARKIRHKTVCQMFDLGEDKGKHYITMEYVPGEDLKSFIRRAAPLNTTRALSIARQICEGLAEAHSLGVVHRDLKPSNIMIDREGNTRIMDFGIARSMTASGLTEEGIIIGTPEYMPPEQAEARDVDQRSDIYSLGIILYEMVTGQVPFSGDTPLSVAMKQKTEIPKDPKIINPQISEDFKRIICKCLEKEKEDRWQNVEELLDELQKIEGLPSEEARKTAWKTSIAVLPFKNMSADPEQEYFCEGLSEELINALTQIKDLRVVARTSAFSFKGKETDIREIGKKLDVETVLEGSVRKTGNRLRVTAQLINVADGFHLWSERFDRELADIFAIQDEISLAIIEKLKVELLGEEKVGMVKRYTKDFKVYNAYLKGLFWRRMLAVDRVNKSIECFNQIIEKDPDYAPAYAALAYAYVVQSSYGPVSPKDVYPKAKECALKALELDDELIEAHESLATVYYLFEWDLKNGKKHLKRALELNPGYAWAYFHLGNIYMWQTEFNEAIKALQKAMDLDPLNVAFHRNLGEVYLYAGQLDRAIDVLKRAIEMDPTFVLTHALLGQVYMRKKMYDEALLVIKKDTLQETSKDLLIGVVYALMGKTEDAFKILEKYTELSKKDVVPLYGMAQLCFALAEYDRGFDWLERAYQDHDIWISWIKTDFLMEKVREDPRYVVLLNKMNQKN